MKRIFYFLFLSVILSCSTEDKVNMIELKGTNIETDLPFTKYPIRIGLDSSNIVVLDLASDSCYYHVASYPDYKYSYSIGRRGNGPGEIQLPTPFQMNEGYLFLYDGTKGNLFSINLIEKQNADLKFFTHFDSIITCTDFVCINDSTVILGDLSGENRLLYATSQSVTGKIKFPSELMKEEDASRGYIWRSYMSMNNELRKIALATQFGEVIEIVDMDDYSIKRAIGKGGVPVSASIQINGYYDVKWRKNEIYALYSAITEYEIRQQRSQDQYIVGGDLIHVFNQDGQKIKTYHLDTLICGFTIDEKNNLLIGITPNNNHPIYIFNLD
ncbi:MAG: TolB-like 6-bladed beta-propeller domain-containing protein [Prevotellaceae bacterium]|jgi:hypothetical protein|nr:TolB-like 6-bladed beta-propeller domain-containing protein [Prevotellaceae bacterium]